ncbi:unnamed protein product [Phytomonas sp. EM1]|nr:unnamed protein product [Phytomonas sp. EM1]|eukprot:CCW65429.1 unnamed protein product [Phytomonas sp. isolate EM1]
MLRVVPQADNEKLLRRVPPLPSPPPKPSFQVGARVMEFDPITGWFLNDFRVVRLLGKGGFAKCYEVSDAKGSYALKVISRTLLSNPKILQKLHSEITIHRRMKHENIVKFFHTFKDEHYVYIVLEKCENGTLMEVLKARPLTVPETQYVMLQCLTAVEYMHEEGVIHRDLKPGNIMLDGNLTVKIGDFGLAAELFHEGDRRRTICGTPNYIAPEILDRQGRGHSFEADLWSLGAIFFTLLVGHPPFQAGDVETTYRRVRAGRYDCPSDLPIPARDLIAKILQNKPTSRLGLAGIRAHPFFTSPPTTPPLSLTQSRSQPQPRRAGREGRAMPRDPNPPLADDSNVAKGASSGQPSRNRQLPTPAAEAPFKRTPRAVFCAGGGAPSASFAVAPPPPPLPPRERDDRRKKNAPARPQPLTTLHNPPQQTLRTNDYDNEKKEEKEENDEEGAPPPSPQVWVVACADFSAKYGLCYRLSTGQTGVYFNDATKMIWDPALGRVEYYARVRVEIPQGDGESVELAADELEAFHIENPPAALEKKIALTKYFTSYLGRTDGSGDDKVKVVCCSPYLSPSPPPPSGPQVERRFIYVKRWLCTDKAIVFRLSNKTIQVCFNDGAEIILSSEWRFVTYTDPSGNRRTLALTTMATESRKAASRLNYIKAILYMLAKENCL